MTPVSLPLLEEHNVKYTSPVQTQMSPILEFMITYVLPVIVLAALFMLVMRIVSKNGGGIGGIGNVGKSNAKVYMEKQTGVTFKDVAGQDEAKESLEEIIDFLHNPGKYTAIGAKLPKGALLVGPPGYRQDSAGQGRGRRGQRALLLHLRLGLCGDVRGRGRLPGPGPLQGGHQDGPLHHFHRRDRHHRQIP